MFSKPNPFDESVAAATNENLTSENWELILGICDRVSRSSPDSARDCVSAVAKRFGSRNANVQLYALALSEALVKNCDINVHREISSRAFTNALSKLIHEKTTHDSVRKRALEFIQMCSQEFSADSSLGLMNEVYHSLRAEGIQFPNPQKPKKEYTQTEMDKQKEEEELQLALALSLSESENRSTYRPSAATAKASSTTQGAEANASKPKPAQESAPKVSRVRALYDFTPTEQGELGFQKGDIIRVIESVYRDWWKGELRGEMGIFPVNYVEKLHDPTPADLMKEAQMEAEVMAEIQNVDRLLDMLGRIDPQRDAFSENEELQTLYNNTLSIRPKLVRLIEKYSVKKDELVALNERFLHARTMYDRMLGSSIAQYTSTAGAQPDYRMSQQYGGVPAYDPQQFHQQQQQQQPPQATPQVMHQQAPQQPYGMYPPQQQQQQSPQVQQQPYGVYDNYQQQPQQQQQPVAQQPYPPMQQSPQQSQQSGAQQQPQQPYGGAYDPSMQQQQQQQQPYPPQQQQQQQPYPPQQQQAPPAAAAPQQQQQAVPPPQQQTPISYGSGGSVPTPTETYPGYQQQSYPPQGYQQPSPAIHQQPPGAQQPPAYGYGVVSP